MKSVPAFSPTNAHPNTSVAVVYGRVSVVIPGKETTSLPGQHDTGAGWATQRNLTVPKEFFLSDNGISGRRYWTRPEIQRALHLIETKQARYLICETVDRAARRAKFALQILDRVWDAGGILVCNGMEFRPDDPNAKLIADMFFGLAEWDYDNTRRKLDGGRRRKALGMHPMHPYRQAMQRGTPAYGLIIPTDLDIKLGKFPSQLLGRHVIVKGDEEQARRLQTVRDLYRQHDNNVPLGRLSKWLRHNGIPSPRGRNVWSDSSLDYLLRNEVYAGAGYIFKTTGKFDEKREIEKGFDAFYRVPTPRDEWERLLPVVLYDPETGLWEDAEPTVDPTVWRRVCEKREAEEAASAGNGRLHFYLSHFGRCAVCGGRWAALQIKNDYGVYTYYRCSGPYVDGERTKGCSSSVFPYLRTETVEAAFLDVLETIARDPLRVEEAITVYERDLYGNDQLALQRDRLLHEINLTQRRLDVTTDKEINAEADGLDRAPYRAKIREFTETLHTLRADLAAVERQIIPTTQPTARSRAQTLARFIDDMRIALTAGPQDDVTAEEKAQALRRIVERIDIDAVGRLVVTFCRLSHIPDLGVRVVGAVVTGSDQREARYNAEQVRQILASVDGGKKTVAQVCEEYAVSKSTFYRWKRGEGTTDRGPRVPHAPVPTTDEEVSIVRPEENSKWVMPRSKALKRQSRATSASR